MFKIQLRCILLVLICLLVKFTVSLYEDQVGKFDWKLAYIGKAKFAHIDAKRVIVATEENVIAALHLKTGQLLWRQILEDPEKESMVYLHVDKEIVTITGTRNSWHVRGWDINSGILLFEYVLSIEHNSKVYWVIKGDVLYQVVPVVGSHIEVSSFVLQTGSVSSPRTRISAPWATELSNCVQTKEYFVCMSSNDIGGNLYYVDVTSESNSIYNQPLSGLVRNVDLKLEIAEFKYPKASVLIIMDNVAFVVVLEDSSANVLPKALTPNLYGVFNGQETLLLQLEINPENPEKLLRIVTQKSDDLSKRNEVEIQYPLGLGAPYTIAANCKNVVCDLLLSSSDSALTLIRIPEAKVLWTREEALSHIVAAELLELPVSELDASIEREFKTSGDVLSMLYQRLASQAKQLSSLFFGGQLLSQRSGLVRDEFGLHKLIVVATSVGKLFGIDTLTGSIVWSYRLPHVVPFTKNNMLLFVQRTARYSPLLAQCILLAKDDHTGNGVLFRFDPISGHSETGIERLNYKIKQAIMLPHEDKDHTKAVVVLSDRNEIYVYPQSATDILYEHAKTTYLFTADSVTGELQGFSFASSTPQEPKLNLNWNLKLGSGKLVGLSMRAAHERVHSQGRVLPDRSVYYKYINPNIIALATITDDPVHKQVLSINLVDGVTGLVLYSANHKRVKAPIHLLHSENWVVYSYFNERFRRTEIATVELYEGRIQSNSTVFSSYAVSQLPVGESQAYILPAVPLTMTTTLTERGITSKFILVALTNGIVTEIPWAFIQPRLPDIACGPEESCIPYMPEIPLPPEASANYNQTLLRVRGIEVAPARLESTSHVLVHGLDLFYTRVAPSKTFDVLKEDFDHKLIVLVLSGLILASYVTKKLASRKALRQAWK